MKYTLEVEDLEVGQGCVGCRGCGGGSANDGRKRVEKDSHGQRWSGLPGKGRPRPCKGCYAKGRRSISVH